MIKLIIPIKIHMLFSVFNALGPRSIPTPPTSETHNVTTIGDGSMSDNYLQVQSWLQASNNTGILNTFTRLSRKLEHVYAVVIKKKKKKKIESKLPPWIK